MKTAPKTVNAFTARTHLGQLMRRVADEGETFIITKKGKAKMVLVGIEEYEDMLEVIEEQHDPGFQQALKDSARQIKQGKVSSLDSLRAIYQEG